MQFDIYSKRLHYVFIGLMFFIIAMGLGYPTLQRYTPAAIDHLDDSRVYANIVQHGFDSVTEDHRSTRILVPLMAKPIYHLVKGKIGTWDSVQFSMLVIASIFCGLIVIMMVSLCAKFYSDILVGLLAGFVFFANFAVTNLYLSGLVDSAESFFLLALFYSLLTNNWKYIPIIALLGTLAKETFLPIGCLILGLWVALQFMKTKAIQMDKVVWLFSFFAVSLGVVITLKSFAFGEMYFPWNYAAALKSHHEFGLERIIVEFRRFLYIFIWLLPLAIFGVKEIPREWAIVTGIAAVLVYIMGVWVGASGIAISRYIFNLAGPVLCIAASLFLIKYLRRVQQSDVC